MGAEKETKKGKSGNKPKSGGDKPGDGKAAAAKGAAPEPKAADDKAKAADDKAKVADDKAKAADDKADDKAKAKNDAATAKAAADKTEATDDKSKATAKPKTDDADKPTTKKSAAASSNDKAAEAPEQLAELIPPNKLPKRSPNSKADPPGPAPRGDSRSFRRAAEAGEEFFLIYRVGRSLVERVGAVGKLGKFDVTEYPSQGAASHAYAQRCSELSAAGYRDLPRR